MPIHDPFTPAERRLAVLLFCLALLGQFWRLGTRVSPEVAAWLEGEAIPAREESLRSPPSYPREGMAPDSSGPAGGKRLGTESAAPATAGPDPGGTRGRPGSGGLEVDLNRAGLEGLLALPGVGPVLARRILEDRDQNGPYRTAEDLLRVPGIGPATLARLRPHVRVQSPPGRLN